MPTEPASRTADRAAQRQLRATVEADEEAERRSRRDVEPYHRDNPAPVQRRHVDEAFARRLGGGLADGDGEDSATDAVPADVTATADALLASTRDLYMQMAEKRKNERLLYGPVVVNAKRRAENAKRERWILPERRMPPALSAPLDLHVHHALAPRSAHSARSVPAQLSELEGSESQTRLVRPAAPPPADRPIAAPGAPTVAPAQPQPTGAQFDASIPSPPAHGHRTLLDPLLEDNARSRGAGPAACDTDNVVLQSRVESLERKLRRVRSERDELRAALATASAAWDERFKNLEAMFESSLARAVADAKRKRRDCSQPTACPDCVRAAVASSAATHNTTRHSDVAVGAVPTDSASDGAYWQRQYSEAMKLLGRTEGQLRHAQRRSADLERRLGVEPSHSAGSRGNGQPRDTSTRFAEADRSFSDIEAA